MTTQRELSVTARRLHRLLKTRNLKVVFAESCTGGLLAATLTQIPGISQYLCGSAVVYQMETKQSWLSIPPKTLAKSDAVTAAVARAMAENVLAQTPQADVSASITGHLGPDAPPALDGLFFIGMASRVRNGQKAPRTGETRVIKGRLAAGGMKAQKGSLRVRRQREAANQVLSQLCTVIEKWPGNQRGNP